MNEVETAIQRLQLEDSRQRFHAQNEAVSMSLGNWRPAQNTLLPPARNKSRQEAWDRALRVVSCAAVEALNKKLQASIGSVQFSSSDPGFQALVQAQELREMSRRLMQSLVCTGIIAAVSHTTPTNEHHITRLGGNLDPILARDNDTIIGLYRCYMNSGAMANMPITTGRDTTFENFYPTNQIIKPVSYTVEVYDWSEETSSGTTCTKITYEDIQDPTDLTGPYTLLENAPRPRVMVKNWDDFNHPVGEFMASSEAILSLYQTDLQLALSQELSSFPLLVATGSISLGSDDGDERMQIGPGELIVGGANSSLSWESPAGNLSELFSLREMKSEQLRRQLSLPGGMLGGGSMVPSGEALRESNQQASQSAASYSLDLSRFLTLLVDDLASLVNNPEHSVVTVEPHAPRDYNEELITSLSLYKEGVIPLRQMVLKSRELFPSFSNEEIEAFLGEQERLVDPDAFLAV